MNGIGVLALQGDWHAHDLVLNAVGAECHAVRTAADLDRVQAWLSPGVKARPCFALMEAEDLRRIRGAIAAGMAVLATCAGVILLAEKVDPTRRLSAPLRSAW